MNPSFMGALLDGVPDLTVAQGLESPALGEGNNFIHGIVAHC
jgi:hypothetical protein